MRRTPKLVMASVIAGASITGVALAATSPSAVTGPATAIGKTTAVLNGRVNPNGRPTSFSFTYGATTSYGAGTPTRSAGAGKKALQFHQEITGLLPGTIYHYRIGASSSAGTTFGADRTFKTTGHAPAAVITGPAENVGKTIATATGLVNPEGATTSWFVEYGLTTAYGSQTSTQTLAAATTPLPVSAGLAGLSPATTYHYRIVAVHNGGFVSDGADATFFTVPRHRARPGIRATTRPRRDRRRPFTFTVNGLLTGATWVPQAERCAGKVGIRFYNGRRQLAFRLAPVRANCGFSATATFRRLHGPAPARIRVRMIYRGTKYLAPAQKIEFVTAG